MFINLTSLIIYLAILVIGADTGRLTGAIKEQKLRRWTRAFCVCLVAMASAFIATQAAYVASGEYFNPNDPLDITWLLFDWINGIAYLCYSLALRVYVLWQSPDKPCASHPTLCPHHPPRAKESKQPCQN